LDGWYPSWRCDDWLPQFYARERGKPPACDDLRQKRSLGARDEHAGYVGLSSEYPDGAVRHSTRNYVVGAIHTNTIEGFWSLVKRSIVGSFHKVSANTFRSILQKRSSHITIAQR
jgi:hypothetical protein